jgi:hypothetical protein
MFKHKKKKFIFADNNRCAFRKNKFFPNGSYFTRAWEFGHAIPSAWMKNNLIYNYEMAF